MPESVPLDQFPKHKRKRKKRHNEQVDVIWLTDDEIETLVFLVTHYGGMNDAAQELLSKLVALT